MTDVHGGWCCASAGTLNALVGNCQAAGTAANQNNRVDPTNRMSPAMDTELNVHAKILSMYPDYPGSPTCCVESCCHRTTNPITGQARGTAHMTVFCSPTIDGTNKPTPARFVNGRNKVHYHCDTGRVQPFTRRLDDPRSGMTIASDEPEWLVPELKAPGLPSLPQPAPKANRRRSVIGETGFYKHLVRTCVNSMGIYDAKYFDKTLPECVRLCDANEDCVAFEFGVDHGGQTAFAQQPGECTLQNSANYDGCDGGNKNTDLYIKTGGYRHVHNGCVNGENIIKYMDKSLMECVQLCDDRDHCLAFEYGGVWNQNNGFQRRAGLLPGLGAGLDLEVLLAALAESQNETPLKAKECILQSSRSFAGCDGSSKNLDLYIKPGKLAEETVHALKHSESRQIGFLGCYVDDGDRDLEYYKGSGHDAQSCSEQCTNFNYFALQNHGECWCGVSYNVHPKYHPVDVQECGADLLGRAWRNAVFVHGNINKGLVTYDFNDFKNPQLSSVKVGPDAQKPELGGTNDGNARNLEACIGECDSDIQCKPGLKCFQRTGFTPVPGCVGTGTEDWDYCYDPTGAIELNGPNDGSATNLQICSGECDSDAQCASGLKCFQRDNGETIPGCTGQGGGPDWDYCYDPNSHLPGEEYEQIHTAADCCRSNGAKVGSVDEGATSPRDCMKACDDQKECRYFSHSFEWNNCALCSKCDFSEAPGNGKFYTSWKKIDGGASAAMDGSTDTHFATAIGDREWLRWELKQPTTVSRVLVANRKDCCANRLGKIDVLLYTTYGWEVCASGVQTSTDVVNHLWTEVYCSRPTRATKVQVQFANFHDETRLHVSEVKVVGMEPHAQYVGCFRDDSARDLNHFKGRKSNHGQCRGACQHYYYFAMQNGGDCYCGDHYATEEQYYKLSDNACGSNLKGKAWANAVFATHGGIPEHDFDASRRLWNGDFTRPLAGNALKLGGGGGSMWSGILENGLRILDETMIHAVCMAREVADRVVHWIAQHPAQFIIASIGTIALIGVAVFFAPVIAPAFAAGLGALGLGEEAAGGVFALIGAEAVTGGDYSIIQALIKSMEPLTPMLPFLGPGGGAIASHIFTTGVSNIVDATSPSSGGLGPTNVIDSALTIIDSIWPFRRRADGSRRLVTEETVYLDDDHLHPVEDMLQSAVYGLTEGVDDLHSKLNDGLTLLMTLPKEAKLQKEWDLYNIVMERMHLDLDESLQAELEIHLETFNDLLDIDFDAAEKCVEKGGCTTTEMQALLDKVDDVADSADPAPEGQGSGDGSGQVSGDGSGAGSAPAGPTHATPTEAPEEDIVEFGEETAEDLPEIDATPKLSRVHEEADGSILFN